jgi:uncharacterized protein (TIGR02246 family)
MPRMTAPIAIVLLLSAPALAAESPTVAGEIKILLDTQAAAWSRGDLDAFCSIYADDATFVSPSGMTRGRQAVLDRYRAKYKDRAGMGTLRLEIQETRALAAGGAASVVARWTLSWPDKPDATGSTLLVLVRSGASWRIAQDASM